MTTAFILYGIGGSAQENWFPWMKAELEKNGIETIIPDFPNADAPTLEVWLSFFDQHYTLHSDSILIGHSLGCTFALRLLERAKTPVRSTFFVSPVWKAPPNKFAPLLTTFTEPPFDWKMIRENGGSIQIIHADNDPYLPLPYAKELTMYLSCSMQIIPGGGHFNETAGYRDFPILRDQILKTL